jgi:hypothetical protein
LQGIGLTGNDLTGWDFSGQNLTSALLSYSTLTNANLAGARLKNANVDWTVDLASANFDASTVYNQWPVFPSGFDPDAAGLTLEMSPAGDLDADDVLELDDVDMLAKRIGDRYVSTWWLPVDAAFDLNDDSSIDVDDHRVWVKELKHTWYGDANLNLEFNSADLVQVLAAGKYEVPAEYDVRGNIHSMSWLEGDWNADGLFNSADLVVALVDGGYEQGPRPPAALVPEPSGLLLVAGLLPLLWTRRGVAHNLAG